MSRVRSSSIITAAIFCCLAMPMQAELSFKERVSDYAVSCKDKTVSLARSASSTTKDYASRGANKVRSFASSVKDTAVVWGGVAKSYAKKRRVQQVAVVGSSLLVAGGLGYYFRENIAQGFEFTREQIVALWASLGIFGAANVLDENDETITHSDESSNNEEGSSEQGETRSVVTSDESNEQVVAEKLLADFTVRELFEQGQEKAREIKEKAQKSGQNALGAMGQWAKELKERALTPDEGVADDSDRNYGDIPNSEL